MRVTTGGITVAAGTVIVLALGGATLKVIRDEASNTGSSECRGQSQERASQARRAFEADHTEGDRSEPREWFVYATTSRADLIRQTIDSMPDLAVSGHLPDQDDEGFIVVVAYDPDRELPPLPDCLADTPIAYLGTGPRVAG